MSVWHYPDTLASHVNHCWNTGMLELWRQYGWFMGYESGFVSTILVQWQVSQNVGIIHLYFSVYREPHIRSMSHRQLDNSQISNRYEHYLWRRVQPQDKIAWYFSLCKSCCHLYLPAMEASYVRQSLQSVLTRHKLNHDAAISSYRYFTLYGRIMWHLQSAFGEKWLRVLYTHTLFQRHPSLCWLTQPRPTLSHHTNFSF